MKIRRIDVHQVDIPLHEPKPYPNKVYDSFDNTVVRIETDSGLIGWGEVCPIGSTYQPEHALGFRAAIEEMAPGLIGQDPTQIGVINKRMNDWLMGGLNAKSAIDIACWDLAGKAYRKPVYQLIGGALQPKAKGYAAVELGDDIGKVDADMAKYRAKGYTHFQIKSKTTNIELVVARLRRAHELRQPGDILVADANKAWRTHEALRILRATEDIDYYVEQPCLTYEECLSIRRQARQPMILDECLTDINVLLKGLADNAFEGIGCKITRVGGITGTCLIRDICSATGKVLTIDDMWGSDLSAAAQAHLAVSTPARTFLASYISTDFSDLRYDINAPSLEGGFITPNNKPGLGVEPDMSVLGESISSFS